MKSLSILLVAISVFAVSCERHEFEGPDGTKQLHEHHGAGHGDSHGDEAHGGEAHGDAHGTHEEKHEEKAAH
ncbi:MAG: hypothetical protein EOP88_11570 [Verrucomicrobiaceae bacterium]|nr:MAG: hypothetical protein EOP88_11570 [Verrucomicrobiaceae bacterium]